MASFKSRNCCAFALGAVVFALMIAASVAPWFKNEQTYNQKTSATASTSTSTLSQSQTTQELNSTKIYYDLNGFKQVSTNNGIKTNNYSTYKSSDLKDIIKVCQAFTIVALILAAIVMTVLALFFFDRVRNKVVFAFGMTATRLIIVIHAALIVLSVAIAFLVFLGITRAFKEDSDGSCADGPCRKFVSSATTVVSQPTATTSIELTQAWGPVEGWYITLASIPVSVVLFFLVVVNKFPLPIDSEASAGEAL